MDHKLPAFKALAKHKADSIRVTSGLGGYGFNIAGDPLITTDTNKPRLFASLDSVATLAREIGLKTIVVEISDQEPVTRKIGTPEERAAKKQAAKDRAVKKKADKIAAAATKQETAKPLAVKKATA